ncbi:MAG: cytochrome-c peroxidase, partial [Chloroflexota bacterium]
MGVIRNESGVVGGVLIVVGLAIAGILLLPNNQNSNLQLANQTIISPLTLTNNQPIQPIPASISLDADKVALGRQLFFDPRLSGDETVSCATCHQLDKGGMDNLPRPIGIYGAEGVINTPTVYNVGFNVAQFWDGRAHSLASQISHPLNNPIEMDSDWQLV